MCNTIWKWTRKVWKITVFQRSVDKIIRNLCLMVKFRCSVMVLTLWNFPKLPKTHNFWPTLAFYRIRSVTTLTVVDSGPPWLHITEKGWLGQKLRQMRPSSKTCANLVPYYSWYLGLALNFRIRSKALTVWEIWQFK